MPELPEVETVKNTLKNFVINKRIVDIQVNYPRIIENDLEEFKQAVINQKITDLDRVGKYLIFVLEDTAFVSHLRMEGKYNILNKPEFSKHDHIIFHLDDGSYLSYNDTRKFGRMVLSSKSDYKNQLPLCKLGAEPFCADPKAVYQRIHKSDMPIKHLLLDQTIMAGIGNIYANEICFAMGIDPFTPGKNLTLKRVEQLIQASSKILEAAIAQGGTTIHSFSANGIDGLFQVSLQVHLQKECKVCHSEIRKEKIKGRSTYYCPKCQRRKS